MKKNQLILAIIGGIAVVAVLAIGYFIYDEMDMQEEKLMTLEAKSTIFNQNRNASDKEASDILENVKAVKAWSVAALAEAAKLTNDVRYAAAMIPSVFQQQMRDDVRRFESLPQNSAAKIVISANTATVFPDFKDYVVDGKLPTEDKALLLQRQWGDICLIVDSMLEAGVQNLESVRIVTPEPESVDPKARKQDKVEPFDSQSYTFVFLARPEALVTILNDLVKAERFIAIDSISFAQEPDPLMTLLTGSSKKGEGEGGRRRSPRRAKQAEAAQPEEETVARSGTVTDPSDPLVCTPFKVTMTVSTLAVRKVEEGQK